MTWFCALICGHLYATLASTERVLNNFCPCHGNIFLTYLTKLSISWNTFLSHHSPPFKQTNCTNRIVLTQAHKLEYNTKTQAHKSHTHTKCNCNYATHACTQLCNTHTHAHTHTHTHQSTHLFFQAWEAGLGGSQLSIQNLTLWFSLQTANPSILCLLSSKRKSNVNCVSTLDKSADGPQR